MSAAQTFLDHAARHAGLLISLCAWCGQVRDAKLSEAHLSGLTHGICPGCASKFTRRAA